MGLLDRLRALLRRPRRDEPVGRHSRVLPGPTVPGAAAALVATTGTAGVVQADAESDVAAPVAAEQVAAQPVPAQPVADEPPEATEPAQSPDSAPSEPAAGDGEPAEPAAAAADAASAAPGASAVTLGFADGGTLALDPDYPRVRTFQAAAQALLEEPRASRPRSGWVSDGPSGR